MKYSRTPLYGHPFISDTRWRTLFSYPCKLMCDLSICICGVGKTKWDLFKRQQLAILPINDLDQIDFFNVKMCRKERRYVSAYHASPYERRFLNDLQTFFSVLTFWRFSPMSVYFWHNLPEPLNWLNADTICIPCGVRINRVRLRPIDAHFRIRSHSWSVFLTPPGVKTKHWRDTPIPSKSRCHD